MYSVDRHCVIFNYWMLQIMLRTFLYMSFGIYMFTLMLHIPKNGITGSQGIHLFSFSRCCKNSFPKWYCFTVLPVVNENPISSTSSLAFDMVTIFSCSILVGLYSSISFWFLHFPGD